MHDRRCDVQLEQLLITNMAVIFDRVYCEIYKYLYGISIKFMFILVCYM